jgi:hypothetical protein
MFEFIAKNFSTISKSIDEIYRFLTSPSSKEFIRRKLCVKKFNLLLRSISSTQFWFNLYSTSTQPPLNLYLTSTQPPLNIYSISFFAQSHLLNFDSISTTKSFSLSWFFYLVFYLVFVKDGLLNLNYIASLWRRTMCTLSKVTKSQSNWFNVWVCFFF